MKVLITGAAGFIGSHVTDSLLADGHHVVGFDNFDPYYDRPQKEANLEAARASDAFALVEADIRDADALEAAFDRHGPFDAVLHLAARAGVRPSIADTPGYTAVNVQGTVAVLEAAAGQDPRPRLVFASSSSVYGNNRKVPFSEADRVDHPISPYAATKKAGELICHTYHHLHDLPVWCLRFFTVYGPRQRPDLAIRKFTRLLLAGEPIEMYGDGTTSRDYTYIDDIVFGIRRALERCSGYEIINLGSEHPVTLAEMIDTVAAACGVRPDIRSRPMQPGDVQRTCADTAKALRLLDYNPSMPFADGIAAQVDWHRSR